jgi:hypothetical protein
MGDPIEPETIDEPENEENTDKKEKKELYIRGGGGAPG